VDSLPLVDTIHDPDIPIPTDDISIPDGIVQSYSLSSKDWCKALAKDPIKSVIVDNLNRCTKADSTFVVSYILTCVIGPV
jgi:hypothetical protein